MKNKIKNTNMLVQKTKLSATLLLLTTLSVLSCSTTNNDQAKNSPEYLAYKQKQEAISQQTTDEYFDNWTKFASVLDVNNFYTESYYVNLVCYDIINDPFIAPNDKSNMISLLMNKFQKNNSNISSTLYNKNYEVLHKLQQNPNNTKNFYAFNNKISEKINISQQNIIYFGSIISDAHLLHLYNYAEQKLIKNLSNYYKNKNNTIYNKYLYEKFIPCINYISSLGTDYLFLENICDNLMQLNNLSKHKEENLSK